MSDLEKFYGITVCEGTDGVLYSNTFCSNCYYRLKTLKRASQPPERTLHTGKAALEKSSGIWTLYDPSVNSSDCTVCSSFVKQRKGGRPLKPDCGVRKKTEDKDEMFESFEPPVASTPHKSVTEAQKCHTPTKEDRPRVETADATTSPLVKEVLPLRGIETLKAPFTKFEEAYYTHFAKEKLKDSEDNETVRCPTGGQPVYLKRFVKPRKPSSKASSPLKKSRARQMQRVRADMSGTSADDSISQQSTELKMQNKSKKKKILDAAGCKQACLSAKRSMQIRAKMLLSWAKHKQNRKFLRKSGVKLPTEKEEQKLMEEVMCGKITTDQSALYFLDRNTNAEVQRDTPIARIENIPLFVENLLEQYQSKDKLTWHNDTIPENEIWVKVGGDHGGTASRFLFRSPIYTTQIQETTHS